MAESAIVAALLVHTVSKTDNHNCHENECSAADFTTQVNVLVGLLNLCSFTSTFTCISENPLDSNLKALPPPPFIPNLKA